MKGEETAGLSAVQPEKNTGEDWKSSQDLGTNTETTECEVLLDALEQGKSKGKGGKGACFNLGEWGRIPHDNPRHVSTAVSRCTLLATAFRRRTMLRFKH